MDKITRAFKVVDRRNFLPKDVRRFARADRPLVIGYGQTNSQPSTVRRMLEWLDPQMGDKILDVGSGSGWSTALLSYLVGEKGKVFAVEIIPELVEIGRQNCETFGITNAEFFKVDDSIGLPEHAPYDRILVSAGARELPGGLIGQLKPGGKLVIPVKYDILEVTKDSKNELHITPHTGFLFVPLK